MGFVEDDIFTDLLNNTSSQCRREIHDLAQSVVFTIPPYHRIHRGQEGVRDGVGDDLLPLVHGATITSKGWGWWRVVRP